MKTANYFKNVSLTALLAMGSFVYAQDANKISSQKVKELADKACECCYEISVNQPKDSIVAKINGCIRNTIINNQIFESLSGKSEEKQIIVDNDTIVSSNIIIANEGFDEIQNYMKKECKAVKTLMFSDNKENANSLSKNKKAMKFYEEGLSYSDEEKYDMAIVSYNKAVKIDPKFAFAWDNLGICYRRMDNYKEAIKCYKKSLELDPTGRVPLMNIGTAYEKLKDYKSAGESFVKLIEIYPEDPEGYFGAGRIFYISQDYEKGVDYMFKAYLKYSENQSPYIHDAEQNLAYYYQDLEQKGKLDIFMQAAKNNNINIQDEEE
ncbi:tetratricopeptide repeat protein [Flavobacterium alkalisoli]|uniref:Tetratricopeptide repeat protein n=1 Tax=Flavobacterium alkalisoli TaxID=2602769 RepID=A0A5B9FRK0_9FLAO|nr:tetratricopeptide repeat protein [Flavobacterium alkalisoli]QEE48731.1 tetratricopeptide repeat protein [Flavobacterium alkalisoli]